MPEELKNPSIEIAGLRVDEPITCLTDLLVAVICFYAFFRLIKAGHKGKVASYLKLFFVLMAVSTALGGFLGHAFNYALSIYWKLPYWLISMISVALAERAVIVYSGGLMKPIYAKVFRWMNLIELATFIVIAFYTKDFIYVVAHSAYGLLFVVGVFHGYVYLKTKHRGSKLFLIGVAWSTLGAVVFLTKFHFSNWFNHLDISHTLMAVSATYFMFGSLIMVKDPDYQIR